MRYVIGICLFTYVHYYSVYLLFFFLIFAFFPRYSYFFPTPLHVPNHIFNYSTCPHIYPYNPHQLFLRPTHPRFPSTALADRLLKSKVNNRYCSFTFRWSEYWVIYFLLTCRALAGVRLRSLVRSERRIFTDILILNVIWTFFGVLFSFDRWETVEYIVLLLRLNIVAYFKLWK